MGINNWWTKPKPLQCILSGQITRAPPWCFPLKIQSCLPTRLHPLITNPPKVKLPSSCWMALFAQCCLPSGTTSLFDHPLSHAVHLLLLAFHCLQKCVLAPLLSTIPWYYWIILPPLSLLIWCLLLLPSRLLGLIFLPIKFVCCIAIYTPQINLPLQLSRLLVARLNLCSSRVQVSTRLTPWLWPPHPQNNIRPAFQSPLMRRQVPMRQWPCPSQLHAHAQIWYVQLLNIHWLTPHHCLLMGKQSSPPCLLSSVRLATNLQAPTTQGRCPVEGWWRVDYHSYGGGSQNTQWRKFYARIPGRSRTSLTGAFDVFLWGIEHLLLLMLFATATHSYVRTVCSWSLHVEYATILNVSTLSKMLRSLGQSKCSGSRVLASISLSVLVIWLNSLYFWNCGMLYI